MNTINYLGVLLFCCVIGACTPNNMMNNTNESMTQLSNAELAPVLSANPSWQLESANDKDGQAIVFIDELLKQKTSITLTFVDTAKNHLSFSAGCNIYNGAYQLKDGRLSLVGDLMSTRMMCYGNEQKTSDYLVSVMQQGAKLSVLHNKSSQNKSSENQQTQPYKLLQITDEGSQLVWAVSDNKMR